MRNKGITLVALVITIIILLILATISINLLMSSGFISKSKYAIEKHKIEQAKEALTIALSTTLADDNSALKSDSFEDKLNKNLAYNKKCKIQTNLSNDESIVLIYDSYLWKIDKNTGEITYISQANSEYTGNGKILDGLNVTSTIELAKKIETNLKSSTNNGYNNVVSSTVVMTAKPTSNEFIWYSENFNSDSNVKDNDKIKLSTEVYCTDNVMIYDGKSEPYVPVMVRFYRERKRANGTINPKKRGLNYVSVNTSRMDFSSNASNNWAFVVGNDAGYNYNYYANSDRQCSSSTSNSPSFNDPHYDHYYACGRLTYSNTPTSLLTNLGSFTASIADQDNNNVATLSSGSNYVVDVRDYYSTLDKAKQLIIDTGNDSKVAAELHELSKAVIEATNNNYSYSNALSFAYELQSMTDNVNAKTNALQEAIDKSRPQISDEVLAVIKSAKNASSKITTQTVDGGYNIAYTSGLNSSSTSNEQIWTVSGVKLATSVYCADNILIYDGTNPYIPVMARFYRKDSYTGRMRGLKYFHINTSNTNFSTSSNNNWAFVKDSKYNYEATSDRQCSSDKSASVTFSDGIVDHYYASGRITYTLVPTQTLTNLGSITATSCDQDGNEKNLSAGSNYLIDVRGYYEAIEYAKSLLTNGNLYTNSDGAYELAQFINDTVKTNFTVNNAEEFSKEIDNLTKQITEKSKNFEATLK